MISSMTGFARSDTELDAGTLSWEVRSVNHRYLETNFRLPEGFRHLEPELRSLVGSKLKRGKVDASLNFHARDDAAPALSLNTELAKALIEKSQAIGDLMDESVKVNPVAIMRWPGVLQEEKLNTEALSDPATKLLGEALDELSASRASEGRRIIDMIEERLQQILDIVDTVSARLPEVLEASRNRMRERAETLEQKIDEERLEQELLILAQKQDVAEELDRLQAHVAEIREALVGEQPVGRRLDFLMQELNREANTLGSKSADATTSKCAVDLKVLIEQMREQVQNVE